MNNNSIKIDQSEPRADNNVYPNYGVCKRCNTELEFVGYFGHDERKLELCTYKKRCPGCMIIWNTNFLIKTL